MPDIFISYKKEERAIAAQLAKRLVEAGYDVWWDAALLAGERFEDEISSVLAASHAVVILWSRKSAASDWVKAEAEAARSQKKALPAVIDDLPTDELPLLYRGLHVCRLRGWDGDTGHPGYAELMNAIGEQVGSAKGPKLSGEQAEAKLAQSATEAEVWTAISVSNDPDADEYRAYLKRFGPNARFAELAHIRIARIEQRERAATAPPVHSPHPRRSRLPVTLLIAGALVLAAGAGWVYFRGSFGAVGDLLVSQETKLAAANCRSWSTGAAVDWTTTLPLLQSTVASDCEIAAAKFPKDGDYKAMLAMVRVQQGNDRVDDGMALARQAIDLNSGLGNFVLGAMYEHGLKLQPDISRAADYYRAASQKGVAQAAGRLCQMAIDHAGTLPFSATPDEIFAFCRAANDANDAFGQVAMGYLYEYGQFGLPSDAQKAREFYATAAEHGSFVGMVRLGALLTRGVSIIPDPDRAFALFRQAADSGLPEALRWLGIAYEHGIGVPPDAARAATFFEAASIRRDAPALILSGYGVGTAAGLALTTPDSREFERLAGDQSKPAGQRVLAQMYLQGQLRLADAAKASQLLQQCAGTLNSFCQQQFGTLLQVGYSGVRDPQKALALFQASADQGNMFGQYWLGYLYDLGQDTPRDPDRAISYYQMAAAQGHLTSINRLKQLGVMPSAAPRS